MAMFARVVRDEVEESAVGDEPLHHVEPKRLTPDGHEVVPGAVAQGFAVPWPELRVHAIYETVEPDTFRGEVRCNGQVVAWTEPTQYEPDAIRLAEDLVVAAVGRLFQPLP